MSEAFEPNRIPATPIMEVVRGYLDTEGNRLGLETFDTYPITLLAERAELNADTLMKTLDGRVKTVDFDVADRLLCVMNLTDLWLTDLSEVYEAAMLQEGHRHRPARSSEQRRCGRAGCSNTFSIYKPNGGRAREYCSRQCRRRAWYARKREKAGLKPRYSNPLDCCVNGHDWTPENTIWANAKGYTKPRKRCKICTYERNEAARLRRIAEARASRGLTA